MLKSSCRYFSPKTTSSFERREITTRSLQYTNPTGLSPTVKREKFALILVTNTRQITSASLASRYSLVFSCTPRPALISVLRGSRTDQVLPQLSLNGSRSAQNQSQTMRAIRKTVTFTSRPRRERYLPMKSRTGLSLFISMEIKFFAKTPLTGVFWAN